MFLGERLHVFYFNLFVCYIHFCALFEFEITLDCTTSGRWATNYKFNHFFFADIGLNALDSWISPSLLWFLILVYNHSMVFQLKKKSWWLQSNSKESLSKFRIIFPAHRYYIIWMDSSIYTIIPQYFTTSMWVKGWRLL
jgi:hypothetical protein